MKWRGDPRIMNGLGGEIVGDDGKIVASISVQVIKKLSAQKLDTLIAVFRDSIRNRMNEIDRIQK